jgi:ribosomal protein S27E
MATPSDLPEGPVSGPSITERGITMSNVKVTCPHCGSQTWVREHYNDPCEKCGKAVPDPYIK